jgi:ADP-heptose:LPS heptosyltransferase
VLVIKLGALGDLMQSLEAFHAIRAFHPDRRLILMTTPPFAAFGSAMPWFDEVWVDPRPKAWQLAAWAALAGRLRREPLSRVYDLQSNQRTGLYFRLLAGPRRPEWSGAASGCSHPRPDFLSLSGHNRDRLLAHLASAGVPAAGPAALSWLDAGVAGFALPDRFVILVPGCSPHRLYKRWPADHYAALACRLEQRGIATVVVGTGADRDAVAEIRARAPAIIDLTGRTSLLEVAGVARAALGAVGNDTGPIFITAAVGTPTLMLMSHHTIAERMAPLGPAVSWLQRRHLADLTVDEVEAALLLRAGAAPAFEPAVLKDPR